jgi:hypothetical protein
MSFFMFGSPLTNSQEYGPLGQGDWRMNPLYILIVLGSCWKRAGTALVGKLVPFTL